MSQPDKTASPRRWQWTALYDGGTILQAGPLEAATLAHQLEQLAKDARNGVLRRLNVEEIPEEVVQR